ncbi:MAG: DNA polymerase III subunit alpha [Ignavibacteriaceae bacterium]|nr:DNA polymerase III subunit alpha [Ignavibacteriaceae bacterium]
MNQEEKNQEFDLGRYRLPKDDGTIQFYPVLPRNTEKVRFDITDFGMILNDEPTKKLIRDGDTIGCFYIESPGMRTLLKKLNVDDFEMLTAASSIIRPGVAESGMMQEFILRHKNPSRRKYLVPAMEPLLKTTYGVMIYQEDVLKVAHHVVGLSLEEADLLRRAMSGKLRSRDAMVRLKEKFTASGMGKGYSRETVEELWRQVESFAGYAFCKAHSASFAQLSFQVAYLKVHYPAEFMAGVLSNQGGYYSAAVYIQECKRLGLQVHLPCINESEYEYRGRGKELRIGLMAIKGLNAQTAHCIIKERRENGRYVSLADLLVRTPVKEQSAALLISCGAMDCFGLTRPSLMRLLDVYLKHKKLLDISQPGLFGHESVRLEQDVITPRDYTLEEKCIRELEAFEYMVSRHPLDFFPSYREDSTLVRAADMKHQAGKKIRMTGWYMSSKWVKTKKGDIMKFLSLEDTTGTFEAVLFPGIYNKVAEKTLSMGPFLVEGRVDRELPTNLIVENLELMKVTDLKASLQWDSAENKYFGDTESFSEEEIMLVESLDAEEMVKAYLRTG